MTRKKKAGPQTAGYQGLTMSGAEKVSGPQDGCQDGALGCHGNVGSKGGCLGQTTAGSQEGTLSVLKNKDVPVNKDVSVAQSSFETDLEAVVVEDGNVLSDNDSLDEEAFPALPSRKASSAPPPPLAGKNGLRPNAWVGAPKKVFMNSGLGGKLSFTPPTSSRVEIKMSEGLSKQQVWGWSLLGQYVGFHPGHFLVNSMMKSWGVKAKYRIEEGWFIFQFGSEEDQDKVLKGGPYFIYGKPMLLKHIPEKFAFNRKEIATIPLWVRMFGISRTFWTPEVLGRIASHIGKPLFLDPVTDSRKRGSYARVLVEVNFAEPIVREVSLAFDDGEVLGCTFLIENEPKYCKGCCSLGHTDEDCSFKEKKSGVGVNARRSRPKDGKKVNPGQVASRPSVGDISERPDAPKAPTMNEVSTSTHSVVPVVGNVVGAVLDEDVDGGNSDGAFSDEESESGSEAAHDPHCERCASPVLTLPSPEAVTAPQVMEEAPFQVVMTRLQKKEAMNGAKLEHVLALKTPSRGPAKMNPPLGSRKDKGKKDKVSS